MTRLGRPSEYTVKIGDAICEQLTAGKSLRSICSKRGMPDRNTVVRWLSRADLADFRRQYATARDIGLDSLADELLHVASTPKKGSTKKSGPNGVEITEGDMVAHRRLHVDSLKWYLSKMAPRRYGDRLELAGSVAFDRAGALKRARDRVAKSDDPAGEDSGA